MEMSDEFMAAFVEFNDAAFAMTHCQLSQVSVAAARLEAARVRFRELFVQVAKAEPLAARDATAT